MLNIRTVKKNGVKRKVPMGNSKKKATGRVKNISPKELADMKRLGIKFPGSLTDVGYHIIQPVAQQHVALDKAVQKYGKTEVLRKLAELYRLDYNKSNLKPHIEDSIKYITGGKRND